MESIGLRELRQDASAVVRRVEAGESLQVTVSGRPVARLVPAPLSPWQRFDQVAVVLAGATDEAWDRDRELVDQGLVDPWEVG